MKKLFIFLIRCYRRFISPYTRPSCIFIPTCSVYAMQAIEKYGAVKGTRLAAKRLMRCHPFHSPAKFNPYDPVP